MTPPEPRRTGAGTPVVEYTDADTFGGAEEHIVHLCTEFRRHSPTLVLHSGAVSDAIRARLRDDVPVVLTPAIRGKSDVGAIAHLYHTFRRLRREGAALVHCHLPTPYQAHFAVVLARLAGMPVVCTEHSALVSPDPSLRRRRAVSQRFMDHEIAVSRAGRRTLVHRLGQRPERVTVVYNGIDRRRTAAAGDREELRRRTREELGVDPATLVIGSVGRLDPVKSYDSLLHACATVAAEWPIEVVIAGEGPLHASLEELAAGLGFPVRLLGHVEDVAALLPAFDVFVLPSRSEGLPLSLLEALAAGIPCLATAVGGVPEILDHDRNGWLIPADAGPADLARALDVLCGDPARRARLGAAGPPTVHSRFERERMAGRTEAVFDTVLRRRGA